MRAALVLTGMRAGHVLSRHEGWACAEPARGLSSLAVYACCVSSKRAAHVLTKHKGCLRGLSGAMVQMCDGVMVRWCDGGCEEWVHAQVLPSRVPSSLRPLCVLIDPSL